MNYCELMLLLCVLSTLQTTERENQDDKIKLAVELDK